MPTDPGGNFTLIPSYFAQAGTTIRTEQHNPVLEDIAQALSQRLMRDGRNGMVGNLNMGSFRITNLAPGTAATDAATVGQGMPIGAVIDFALPTAPEGWLLCFGQELASDTLYPLLRAALIAAGSPYGSSSGNPLLPDARGRVSAGKNNMGGAAAGRLATSLGGVDGLTLGASGGFSTRALTVDQLPAHAHSGTTNSSGSHSHAVDMPLANSAGPGNGFVPGSATGTINTRTTSTDGSHAHSFTTNNQGGGLPFSTVQPTIVLNKIIKAAY